MGKEDYLPSGSGEIDSLLLFSAEIDKMTAVERRTLLIDRSRRENDAEHSWHIAVMAILFEGYALERPDIGRVTGMCAVHDLVEIYAGDTFAYDEKGNLDKEAREKEAADRLFGSLPEEKGRSLRALWEEFDAMETADAKYAACMDRLQPFLHNVLTGGHTWVEGKTHRAAVEKRTAVIREFMPALVPWIEENLDRAVERGWLLP